jgi:hypothetical protein
MIEIGLMLVRASNAIVPADLDPVIVNIASL